MGFSISVGGGRGCNRAGWGGCPRPSRPLRFCGNSWRTTSPVYVRPTYVQPRARFGFWSPRVTTYLPVRVGGFAAAAGTSLSLAVAGVALTTLGIVAVAPPAIISGIALTLLGSACFSAIVALRKV